MTPGGFDGVFIGRPFAQELKSESLVFDVLGMFEREVAEHTKAVARRLVEQDAKRQRAVRMVPPMVQAAFDCIGVKGGQPLADQFVEAG